MAKASAPKKGGRRSDKLRILVSNDDGINAPGLKVAEKIARALTSDVWVVAPETEQSGASHSLTLHEPLRMRKISSRRYAVRGTPTDCVIMALNQILRDEKLPDLLISGCECVPERFRGKHISCCPGKTEALWLSANLPLLQLQLCTHKG